MVHTYEVWVDIREYLEFSACESRLEAARYEVDAESWQKALDSARGRARSDYPQATEHDIRITRLLK